MFFRFFTDVPYLMEISNEKLRVVSPDGKELYNDAYYVWIKKDQKNNVFVKGVGAELKIGVSSDEKIKVFYPENNKPICGKDIFLAAMMYLCQSILNKKFIKPKVKMVFKVGISKEDALLVRAFSEAFARGCEVVSEGS